MITRFLCLALLSALSLPAAAAMIYTDRLLFEATLDVPITDGYDKEVYPYDDDPLSPDPFTSQYSNADMNALFGETRYEPLSNFNNVVSGQDDKRHYCAGCNGSFLLDFTATSVGTTAGVFGVGFNIFGDEENVQGYYPLVTFGDGSSFLFNDVDDEFKAGNGEFPFWGITDDVLLIASIQFVDVNGNPQSGDAAPSIAIDDLTIGAMRDMSAIPLPAAFWLFFSALVALAGLRSRTTASAA